MKLAFLKNAYDPYSLAIKLWTSSKYSHIEIIFGHDLWFSASAPDGGTRFCVRSIQGEEWDYLDIPCSTKEENICLDYALQFDGARYDYKGIFAFLGHTIFRENPSKWFCSEIVGAILQQIGRCGTENPSKLTPKDIYRLTQAS